MMTIAPELPGAAETIQYARTLGVHSSLGHSNATYQEAQSGIAAGADHATHTFNAMRPLDHRDPGILGAVLENDELTADIIADGIHVHPSILKLFLRAKGADRAILITDAISATDMPDGIYSLGGLEVQVSNGRCEYSGQVGGQRSDPGSRNPQRDDLCRMEATTSCETRDIESCTASWNHRSTRPAGAGRGAQIWLCLRMRDRWPTHHWRGDSK